MGVYLGIDTSNYTTSLALYDSDASTIVQLKKLLEVKPGEKGLRQADALFQHTKQLPILFNKLFTGNTYDISAVGVSVRPRSVEGSYMPCFLAGNSSATAISATKGIPLYTCSHQEGHIAAALFSSGRLDLFNSREFIAMHLSGGTTECVRCTSSRNVISTELLCATSDLNAGQAIDRIGLMLGLTFPCGPQLEVLARASNKKFKIKPTFVGHNPSISGLENRCAKMLSDGEAPENIARYAIDYILAVVDTMSSDAIVMLGSLPIIYAGGVMSNRIIAEEISKKYDAYFAEPEFSADNSAGVAILAAWEDGAI